MIDTSNSMLFPLEKAITAHNKLSFSIYAAAALIELLKSQRDAVGLTLFDSEIYKHYPAKSNPTQQKMIYHELEELLKKDSFHETSATQSSKALNQIAENYSRTFSRGYF